MKPKTLFTKYVQKGGWWREEVVSSSTIHMVKETVNLFLLMNHANTLNWKKLENYMPPVGIPKLDPEIYGYDH